MLGQRGVNEQSSWGGVAGRGARWGGGAARSHFRIPVC